MIDNKTQSIAIANFKEQSIEELQKEVSNDEVEITLQKLEKNKELTKEQEDFMIESGLEQIREERDGEIDK